MDLGVLILELRRQGVTFDYGREPPFSGPTEALTPDVVRALESDRDRLLELLDPEAHRPVMEARQMTQEDLSTGEQRIINQWRDANSEDFARLLRQHHDEGMITGEAEVQVVACFIARELGIDHTDPGST